MNNKVTVISGRRLVDERGWFTESYSARRLPASGIDCAFVQDNHSYSAQAGTVRGVHFQAPPHAQAKLVRCLRGRIIDYAVDLRRGSPTYGRAVGVELTADNTKQLFIPIGFGHAFVTLEPDVEVAYKVSDFYTPECEGGVIWSDPALGIDWPLPSSGAVLSVKDRGLPPLSALDSPFDFDGCPLELAVA